MPGDWAGCERWLRRIKFFYKIYSGEESWNEIRETNAEMAFLSAASIMSDEAPRNGQNENDGRGCSDA